MARARFLNLDPASSVVLRRFAFAAPAIMVWAVIVDPQDPMPMLATMMLVAAVVDALLAVLRGHVFNGPSLNYWDGASGFFAAHCLARALS
jgi:hypothetical protein